MKTNQSMNSECEIDKITINYDISTLGVLFIRNVYVDPKFRGQGRFKKLLRDLQNTYKVPIELESFHTLVPMYLHLGFIDMGEIDDQGYHLMRLEFN